MEHSKPPDDWSRGFSRWLYADLECFVPSSIKIKKPTEEVQPKITSSSSGANNRIDDLQITYLTSQLDSDAKVPLSDVNEIVTQIIEVEPSSSLLQAHAAAIHPDQVSSSRDALARDGESDTDPMLHFKLKTLRTLIDRRPMLKRQELSSVKASPLKAFRKGESPGSQCLIGPGEDCDGSDNETIIEIDCDR